MGNAAGAATNIAIVDRIIELVVFIDIVSGKSNTGMFNAIF
jgi:hypothetical protein